MKWVTARRDYLLNRCTHCGGTGKIKICYNAACFCTGKCQTKCHYCNGTGKRK